MVSLLSRPSLFCLVTWWGVRPLPITQRVRQSLISTCVALCSSLSSCGGLFRSSARTRQFGGANSLHLRLVRRGVLSSSLRRVHDSRGCLYAKSVRKNLHGLKESVAITFPTNVGGAILPGVVRVILLTPTTAILGVSIRLPKMTRMTPAIHMSLDNFDLDISGMIEFMRLMVSVDIVHLVKMLFTFWWLATVNDRAASLKSSRLDIVPEFFPSSNRSTSMFWRRSLSSQVAI